MKRFILTASLLFGMVLSASAQVANNSKQQIEGVVDAFRTAIINKDKEKFMQLFLREETNWVMSLTERSRNLIHASHSDEPRPSKTDGNETPRAFIESLVKEEGPQEEIFDNVRIDTDGEIAQVWFNYVFKEGAYASNWGKEAWQLVRTDAGWKIVSVIWTVELNPVRPPKRK